MAYTKDASTNKVNQAFNHASMRAALKAMKAHVIGGTEGTSVEGQTAGLAVASSGVTKFQIANAVTYTINGKVYSQAALNEILWPAALGTQGTASYRKYLIYAGTDALATTSGYVAGGNEAAASADAKLPDLPDDMCPLGYCEMHCDTAAWVAGTGTQGTWATWVDLESMPVDL